MKETALHPIRPQLADEQGTAAPSHLSEGGHENASAAREFALLDFFNDTAPTEIYTLSLHDALPIWAKDILDCAGKAKRRRRFSSGRNCRIDRKSTRLNSSHLGISYAVFCLKKQ